jgi:hypothetical protein
MSRGDTIYLPPTKDRPAEPAPYVLTQDEVVRLLRLESTEKPYETLLRYRKLGLLKATQVGKHIRYQTPDVIDFLAKTREANPR